MMQLAATPRSMKHCPETVRVAPHTLRPSGERTMSTAESDNMTARMLAVRDARSRADFAALFEHFAPRLKGWLMRGGLSGAQA
mgnify:CR=1 FL=1